MTSHGLSRSDSEITAKSWPERRADRGRDRLRRGQAGQHPHRRRRRTRLRRRPRARRRPSRRRRGRRRRRRRPGARGAPGRARARRARPRPGCRWRAGAGAGWAAPGRGRARSRRGRRPRPAPAAPRASASRGRPGPGPTTTTSPGAFAPAATRAGDARRPRSGSSASEKYGTVSGSTSASGGDALPVGGGALDVERPVERPRVGQRVADVGEGAAELDDRGRVGGGQPRGELVAAAACRAAR